MVGFVAVYAVLAQWLLPKLGIPTRWPESEIRRGTSKGHTLHTATGLSLGDKLLSLIDKFTTTLHEYPVAHRIVIAFR